MRLSLPVTTGSDVTALQSGRLPSWSSWGTDYTPTHLNLATQTLREDSETLLRGIRRRQLRGGGIFDELVCPECVDGCQSPKGGAKR